MRGYETVYDYQSILPHALMASCRCLRYVCRDMKEQSATLCYDICHYYADIDAADMLLIAYY